MPEVTPDQVADAIANAREYLERNRWVRDSNGIPGESGCLWGALMFGNVILHSQAMLGPGETLLHQVYGIGEPTHPVALAAHAVARQIDPDNTLVVVNVITHFNDRPVGAHREDRPGRVRPGQVTRGEPRWGMAWRGAAGTGLAWSGRAVARRGKTWQVMVRLGEARRAVARLGMVRLAKPRLGKA